MNKHILPLVLVAAAAVTVIPVAQAITVRSEIDWTQMQISLDPDVSLVGHNSFYHSVSARSRLGADNQSTENPTEFMQVAVNDPQGQSRTDGGVLANGVRQDGIMRVSSPGYSYYNFWGSDSIQGRFELGGEGWVRITIPYLYSVSPDPAGDNAGHLAAAWIEQRLAISQGTDRSSVIEDSRYLFQERHLQGVDSSVYGTSGAFSFDFYNVDNTSYFYDINTTIGLEITPVPEPETWAMLGMGAVLLVMRKRHGSPRAA